MAVDIKARQRWGPAIGDETPGIAIDPPEQSRRIMLS